MWNVDSWDWKKNPAESVSRLVGALNTPGTWDWANPAGTSYDVLGHDIHEVTVTQFLPSAISEAKMRGWTITTSSAADCFATTRWIEGGEEVYARNKGSARGLVASGITGSVPVPSDYVDLGGPPGGNGGYGQTISETAETARVAATTIAAPASTATTAQVVIASTTESAHGLPRTASSAPATASEVIENSKPIQTGKAGGRPILVDQESGSRDLFVRSWMVLAGAIGVVVVALL